MTNENSGPSALELAAANIQNTHPNYIADANDPRRVWHDLGGDLEASYDGARYVDIRVKGSKTTRMFISKGALEKALTLFNPEPICP